MILCTGRLTRSTANVIKRKKTFRNLKHKNRIAFAKLIECFNTKIINITQLIYLPLSADSQPSCKVPKFQFVMLHLLTIFSYRPNFTFAVIKPDPNLNKWLSADDGRFNPECQATKFSNTRVNSLTVLWLVFIAARDLDHKAAVCFHTLRRDFSLQPSQN